MGVCSSAQEKKKKLSNNFKTNNTFTTNSHININNTNNIFEKKNSLFEKGEHYYIRKTDLNYNNNNNNEEENEYFMNIDLFLSLEKIENIENNYSIKLSICNNKKINQFTYLGETEKSNGQEIIFGSSFGINYFFEKEQILNGEILANSNIVSNFSITIGQIMGSKGLTKRISIKNIKNESFLGDLVIEAKKREENDLRYILFFNLSLILERNNFKPNLRNIFFVIKAYNDGKNWRPIYKSGENNIECNKEFKYKEIKIESNVKEMKINFEIYDSFDEVLIGNGIILINDLLNNQKNIPFSLELDDPINNYQIGTMKINFKMMKKNSFVDYLKAGMQINMEIAIDYTSSNGDPQNSSSHHYINGNFPNNYENAITNCCSIVSCYDEDQKFPVYGFGGIPPNNSNEVSHCFNINLEDNPDIDGLENIIPIYKKSLKKVILSGPTYFCPVIKSVYNKIKNNKNQPDYINHYFILMILTDGLIHDMKETIDILVDCAYIPLSVIIIGIGNADFKNMNILDGDETLLVNSKNETTKRDLVQFVEYNKFKDFLTDGKNKDLTEEVLKEIPRQVEEYYELMGDFNFG